MTATAGGCRRSRSLHLDSRLRRRPNLHRQNTFYNNKSQKEIPYRTLVTAVHTIHTPGMYTPSRTSSTVHNSKPYHLRRGGAATYTLGLACVQSTKVYSMKRTDLGPRVSSRLPAVHTVRGMLRGRFGSARVGRPLWQRRRRRRRLAQRHVLHVAGEESLLKGRDLVEDGVGVRVRVRVRIRIRVRDRVCRLGIGFAG